MPKKGSEHPPALVFKIDCQSEASTNLSKEQIKKVNEIVESTNTGWRSVGLADIKEYNWDRLIKESNEFIDEHILLYDEIVKVVWMGKSLSPGWSANEKKFCRICWNENRWIKPSGRHGKSKNDTHEAKYGFGHEEWLFDFDKIINGYHYAFLEPLRETQNKYKNSSFDLTFYSIDGSIHQKYFIGEINGVEVIDRHTSESIIAEYKRRGWLKEMQTDLETVGLNPNKIENEYIKESQFLNVRFKVKYCKIYEDPVPITDKHLFKYARYILQEYPAGFHPYWKDNEDSGYDFNSGSTNTGPLSKKTRKSFGQREVEYVLKHNELSTSFLKYLQSNYPNDESRRECKAFGMTKIDIVRRSGNDDYFYEIKTYPDLKTSLRVAFGQLFEYCFFPEAENAKKLFLVSDLPPDSNFEQYIKHVNTKINIPLGYIQYDVETEEVIGEI